jgi:hypothetical protein
MSDTIDVDGDGYPEEECFQIVEDWSSSDFKGLIEYIAPAFERYGRIELMISNYADVTGAIVATGGWSGCEDVIGSMRRNTVWWMMYWHSSYRGGKFVFEIRGNE